MQLDSMFISNCNNTLHVSDAFCVQPSGALKNCSYSLLVYDMRRSEVSNKGVQGRWILHPIPCHTPEAATTVSKCS